MVDLRAVLTQLCSSGCTHVIPGMSNLPEKTALMNGQEAITPQLGSRLLECVERHSESEIAEVFNFFDLLLEWNPSKQQKSYLSSENSSTDSKLDSGPLICGERLPLSTDLQEVEGWMRLKSNFFLPLSPGKTDESGPAALEGPKCSNSLSFVPYNAVREKAMKSAQELSQDLVREWEKYFKDTQVVVTKSEQSLRSPTTPDEVRITSGETVSHQSVISALFHWILCTFLSSNSSNSHPPISSALSVASTPFSRDSPERRRCANTFREEWEFSWNKGAELLCRIALVPPQDHLQHLIPVKSSGIRLNLLTLLLFSPHFSIQQWAKRTWISLIRFAGSVTPSNEVSGDTESCKKDKIEQQLSSLCEAGLAMMILLKNLLLISPHDTFFHHHVDPLGVLGCGTAHLMTVLSVLELTAAPLLQTLEKLSPTAVEQRSANGSSPFSVFVLLGGKLLLLWLFRSHCQNKIRLKKRLKPLCSSYSSSEESDEDLRWMLLRVMNPLLKSDPSSSGLVKCNDVKKSFLKAVIHTFSDAAGRDRVVPFSSSSSCENPQQMGMFCQRTPLFSSHAEYLNFLWEVVSSLDPPTPSHGHLMQRPPPPFPRLVGVGCTEWLMKPLWNYTAAAFPPMCPHCSSPPSGKPACPLRPLYVILSSMMRAVPSMWQSTVLREMLIVESSALQSAIQKCITAAHCLVGMDMLQLILCHSYQFPSTPESAGMEPSGASPVLSTIWFSFYRLHLAKLLSPHLPVTILRELIEVMVRWLEAPAGVVVEVLLPGSSSYSSRFPCESLAQEIRECLDALVLPLTELVNTKVQLPELSSLAPVLPRKTPLISVKTFATVLMVTADDDHESSLYVVGHLLYRLLPSRDLLVGATHFTTSEQAVSAAWWCWNEVILQQAPLIPGTQESNPNFLSLGSTVVDEMGRKQGKLWLRLLPGVLRGATFLDGIQRYLHALPCWWLMAVMSHVTPLNPKERKAFCQLICELPVLSPENDNELVEEEQSLMSNSCSSGVPLNAQLKAAHRRSDEAYRIVRHLFGSLFQHRKLYTASVFIPSLLYVAANLSEKYVQADSTFESACQKWLGEWMQERVSKDDEDSSISLNMETKHFHYAPKWLKKAFEEAKQRCEMRRQEDANKLRMLEHAEQRQFELAENEAHDKLLTENRLREMEQRRRNEEFEVKSIPIGQPTPPQSSKDGGCRPEIFDLCTPEKVMPYLKTATSEKNSMTKSSLCHVIDQSDDDSTSSTSSLDNYQDMLRERKRRKTEMESVVSQPMYRSVMYESSSNSGVNLHQVSAATRAPHTTTSPHQRHLVERNDLQIQHHKLRAHHQDHESLLPRVAASTDPLSSPEPSIRDILMDYNLCEGGTLPSIPVEFCAESSSAMQELYTSSFVPHLLVDIRFSIFRSILSLLEEAQIHHAGRGNRGNHPYRLERIPCHHHERGIASYFKDAIPVQCSGRSPADHSDPAAIRLTLQLTPTSQSKLGKAGFGGVVSESDVLLLLLPLDGVKAAIEARGSHPASSHPAVPRVSSDVPHLWMSFGGMPQVCIVSSVQPAYVTLLTYPPTPSEEQVKAAPISFVHAVNLSFVAKSSPLYIIPLASLRSYQFAINCLHTIFASPFRQLVHQPRPTGTSAVNFSKTIEAHLNNPETLQNMKALLCSKPGDLNQWQLRAVAACLYFINPQWNPSVPVALPNNASPVLLIEGPPGTGKTQTIGMLLVNLVHRLPPGRRILVCASSNCAVDEVLLRYINCKKCQKTSHTGELTLGSLIRVGVRDKVHSDVLQYQPPLFLDKVLQCSDLTERSTGRSSPISRKQCVLSSARVIFSTLGSLHQLSGINFEATIVDEASQSTEPDVVQALALTSGKCILVGDSKQLQPTVLCIKSADKGMSRSLLERLLECGFPSFQLRRQYRMHPDICHFPNEYVYGGVLETDERVLERQALSPVGQKLANQRRFRFTDVPNGVMVRSDGASSANPIEARQLVSYMRSLRQRLSMSVKTFAQHCGIITFYRGQCSAIRNELTFEERSVVTVATVDSYQGQEMDIILISCVRAPARTAAGNASLGFLTDVGRLNVSLTRARELCVMFGHRFTLCGRSGRSISESLVKRSNQACNVGDFLSALANS